jgi:nicotinamide riboside transporter PnuC
MTSTEMLGFVTGAASVLWALGERAWNWPVGIANHGFFLIVCSESEVLR